MKKSDPEDREAEKLKLLILSQVNYQTRWVRRALFLLGIIGFLLLLSGSPVAALGLCMSIIGFSGLVVVSYGLRDDDTGKTDE